MKTGMQIMRLGATLVGAVCVGVVIPAAWFWVGGQIQGSTGARPAAFAGIVVTVVGIIASYIVVLSIAGRSLARRPSEAAHRRRQSWTTSHSGERHAPASLSSLEQVFANAAIIVGVAFILWVLLFPTSSLPPPGGP